MIGIPRDQWDDLVLAVAAMIAATSKWLQAGRASDRATKAEEENERLSERVRLLERDNDLLQEKIDRLDDRLSIRRSLTLGE